MRLHSSMSDGLLAPLFTSPQVEAHLTDEALLQAMLDVEAALARAGADIGVVPAAAADAIAAACRVERFDIADIGAAADASGNPVVPLVKVLRSAVGEPAAQWVHFGTTSQDIVDTALMLLVMRAGEPVVRCVRRAADACAELADRHRNSVTVARTLGQQAVPTTFGLKAATWLSGLDAAGRGLDDVIRRRAAVQLGGAAGTLAGYGTTGLAAVSALARGLGLCEPALPWHTDRQRLVEIAHAFAAVGPAAAKIATDVLWLASTEVSELREGGEAGDGRRGGSSAMPNKENPVHSVLIRAGALQMPGLVATLHQAAVHENERAAGGWHAEWESLRSLISFAGGVADRCSRLLADLHVDPARMLANLEASGGEIMAEALVYRLRPLLGHDGSSTVVQRCLADARQRGGTFRAAVAADEHVRSVLAAVALDEVFEPRNWLGSTSDFIDRALLAHEWAWA
jgi:3-carboxy-cis,cis-muconate cycloisomerase